MQYLVTTADLALTYRRSATYNTGCIFRPGDDPPTAQPHAVGDAGLSSPKSTSAWSFFVAGAAVFWKVMAQLDPSLSSGEAEFYALTSAIATAIHMRQLMEELQYVWLSPTLVFTDGRAAKLMVKDGNSTPSVRHIDLKWWFANHHVDVALPKRQRLTPAWQGAAHRYLARQSHPLASRQQRQRAVQLGTLGSESQRLRRIDLRHLRRRG